MTTAAVDEWFATHDHPLATEMQAVRAIILDTDPRIDESIKWKTPTFSYRGNIASFSPAKRIVSLMFHRGAEIPGDHPNLVGDGRLVRTMRFTDIDDINRRQDELTAVIRSWCAHRDGEAQR
ncbi:MAG: DUF1801 domain-containing protein [Actinomycetota bacterium]